MPSTIITGAAGALGSALARVLVSHGKRVALVDTPESAQRLAALEGELGQGGEGPCAVAIPIDATSAADWNSAMARVDAALGPPRGAVLVAGGWRGGPPVHAETDDVVFQSMMRANLETTHQSLRAILPGMVARRRGSVVVVGSRVSERPWTGAGAAGYTAAKTAVVALAQAVAAEVIEHGVRVNAVLPSVIDTPANRVAMPDADPARWVTPDSMAGVVEFLLSDAARDVSGAAIPVYGLSSGAKRVGGSGARGEARALGTPVPP